MLAHRTMMASSGSAGGYTISNSVYGDGSTGYLNRTLTTPTDGKKFTLSVWIKRNPDNTANTILSCGIGTGSNPRAYIGWDDNSNFTIDFKRDGTGSHIVMYNVAYRDPSAWEHYFIVMDTTQATAADRAKMWLNGTQVTLTISTSMTQNDTSYLNSALSHDILRYDWGLNGGYASDYFAEYHFIDGQALTPSSFGETDSVTGSWKPKAYSGTYGTNGFYLKFENSAALGTDSSGNGNTWTKTGTVTQTTDSPTDKAATNVGNFCTLNPVHTRNMGTMSNGNLSLTGIGAAYSMAYATVCIPTTGKWAFKMTITTAAGGGRHGIVSWGSTEWTNEGGDQSQKPSTYVAYVTCDWAGQIDHGYNSAGNTTDHAAGASFATGDYVEWLVDRDAGTVQIKKNGSAYQTVTGLPTTVPMYVYGTMYNGGVLTWDFGQISYTPSDSSYKRLSTANLPAPTIKKATPHVKTGIYTGTGASLSVTGVGFQPDVVLIDRRNVANTSAIFTSVRGAGVYAAGDATGGEVTDANSLTAFGADGFTLGTSSTVNTSGGTYYYVAFKGGGTAASNTSGSITSSVSANTTAQISVGTYTGTGANATVGHGLTSAPAFLFITQIASGAATNRIIWQTPLANTEYVILNGTDTAKQTGATTHFNSTSPTSSVFSVGTSGDTNASGKLYLFIACAEVAGFSKFTSFTGNASTDGPFIWTGMRSQFIMQKRADATTSYGYHFWTTAQDTYNFAYKFNYFGISTQVENPTTTIGTYDINANGLKVRGSTGDFNGSGSIQLVAAFAEFPFGGTSTTQGKAR